MKGIKLAMVLHYHGCILGFVKKEIKKKGSMGVVEECHGYWCRDNNCVLAIAISPFMNDHSNYVL